MASFRPSSLLTATYLLPAILVNPVLCLHVFNLLLSSLLGPFVSAGPQRATQTRTLVGSMPVYPYADMHASDNLCWVYTACMVIAQLVAYTKVRLGRERRRDIQTAKMKAPTITQSSTILSSPN